MAEKCSIHHRLHCAGNWRHVQVNRVVGGFGDGAKAPMSFSAPQRRPVGYAVGYVYGALIGAISALSLLPGIHDRQLQRLNGDVPCDPR